MWSLGLINKRVILKGGFGNQLFQWGFAHYLQSLGYRVSLIAYENSRNIRISKPTPSQYSQVRELMVGCECIKMETYYLSVPVYRGLRDVQSSWHPFRKISGFYENFESNPFQIISHKEIARIRSFSGYFQNYKFIESVEHILVSELQAYFKRLGFNFKVNNNGYSNVLHARRGDYAKPSHFSTIGILSSSYYQNATNFIDSNPWIALTDDPKNILDITSRIEIDKVLGPLDLDTLGALSTMANSSNLIISNSTLAWWGGLLSIHQGGRVLAPSPWFRDDTLDRSWGIMHKEFQKVPAEFLENLAEYALAHMPNSKETSD